VAGKISYSDFCAFFGDAAPIEELQELFLATTLNDEIAYTEWVALMFFWDSSLVDKALVAHTFDLLDLDGDGCLGAGDIKRTLLQSSGEPRLAPMIDAMFEIEAKCERMEKGGEGEIDVGLLHWQREDFLQFASTLHKPCSEEYHDYCMRVITDWHMRTGGQTIAGIAKECAARYRDPDAPSPSPPKSSPRRSFSSFGFARAAASPSKSSPSKASPSP